MKKNNEVVFLEGEVVINNEKMNFDNDFSIAILNKNGEVFELLNNNRYQYLGVASKINNKNPRKYYEENAKHIATFKKNNEQWFVEVEPL